ncbi:tRNA uridine-5-carboxymethylaminomethyl(34) synthesis GTPase MnmE [bacterium]|nr:tRNA uridine-5-carboxymethylaminomethyl(34) synthesis GTPase MnmE [bacterium]
MNNSFADTIAAVATPPGSGGVAIVRLSGPDSLRTAEEVVRKSPGWIPRRMYFCKISDGEDNVIDEALTVYMPAPHSYTGEDVVEIHCHGGLAVPNIIVDLCVAAGARLAHPGEFTYRAFMSGKMDLAEVEAVLALIQARSKDGAALAAACLGGSLSAHIKSVKDKILDVAARYEAEIDYGDEFVSSDMSVMRDNCEAVLEEVEGIISMASRGRTLTEGIETVLIGPPNAGKSTLWNLLIGEDRALVTPYPGTTRDMLAEYVNLDGLCLHVTDTAGLRDTDDFVESLGIAKTKGSLDRAELIIIVIDGSCDIPEDFLTVLDSVVKMPDKRLLLLLNKQDCGLTADEEMLRRRFSLDAICRCSLKLGQGTAEIKQKIRDICLKDNVNTKPLNVNQRQRQIIVKLRDNLTSLLRDLDSGVTCDCLLYYLHDCIRWIDELTGENVSDDILDRVFSKFCLGK